MFHKYSSLFHILNKFGFQIKFHYFIELFINIVITNE